MCHRYPHKFLPKSVVNVYLVKECKKPRRELAFKKSFVSKNYSKTSIHLHLFRTPFWKKVLQHNVHKKQHSQMKDDNYFLHNYTFITHYTWSEMNAFVYKFVCLMSVNRQQFSLPTVSFSLYYLLHIFYAWSMFLLGYSQFCSSFFSSHLTFLVYPLDIILLCKRIIHNGCKWVCWCYTHGAPSPSHYFHH